MTDLQGVQLLRESVERLGRVCLSLTSPRAVHAVLRASSLCGAHLMSGSVAHEDTLLTADTIER